MVIVMMNDDGLKSPGQIKAFLGGLGNKVTLKVSKASRYAWIASTLKRTEYFTLPKKDRGTVFEYLMEMTTLSRQQLSRLIRAYREHRWIGKKTYERHCFAQHYTRADIFLLAQTDEYHQTLSGPATKKLLERAYQVYKDVDYERLAFISVDRKSTRLNS